MKQLYRCPIFFGKIGGKEPLIPFEEFGGRKRQFNQREQEKLQEGKKKEPELLRGKPEIAIVIRKKCSKCTEKSVKFELKVILKGLKVLTKNRPLYIIFFV